LTNQHAQALPVRNRLAIDLGHLVTGTQTRLRRC
jgi:hypothetical protein